MMGVGAVVFVLLLVVGREGLEMVLFLWLTLKSVDLVSVLVGVVVGLVIVVVLGYLIYCCSVMFDLVCFFCWIGIGFVVVVVGVLLYGVHDL